MGCKNAVGNDIQFGVDVAKKVACTLVEEESGLDLSKFTASGTGGAALDKPRFTCGVVTLDKEDGMGVMAPSFGFSAVEVAAHCCYVLCCILKQVDTDE